MSRPEYDLAKLRRILTHRLSEGELRTLCFDIEVDYEDIAGTTKSDKVREMIIYLDRRGKITALIEAGKALRSDIDWLQFTNSRTKRNTSAVYLLGLLLNDLQSKKNKSLYKFFMTGVTGAGKSATINSLANAIVAEERAFMTTQIFGIHYYKFTRNNTIYIVYEQVGLFDEDLNEINKLPSTVEIPEEDIDIFFYVINANAQRLSSSSVNHLASLTKLFGANVWSKLIVLLTHANSLPFDEQDIVIETIKRSIVNIISKMTDPVTVSKIEFLAIDNDLIVPH